MSGAAHCPARLEEGDADGGGGGGGSDGSDGESEQRSLLRGRLPSSAAAAAAALPKPGSGMLAEQAAVVALFWGRFRIPMLAVWSTAFGGALHEPAVPFFYLMLGARRTH